MTDLEPDQQPGLKNRRWIVFFAFLGIQSIPVLYRLLSLPADPKNSLILGFSLPRLILMAAVLVLGGVLGAAACISGKRESRLQSVFEERWHDGSIFRWLEGLAVFIALLAWGFLVYLRSGINGADDPLYLRLRPVLIWLIALGIQFAIWLWVQGYGFHLNRLSRFRSAFIASAIAAGIFFVLGLIMWFTGWGITSDIFMWGNPGVPILAWQLWIALAGGFAFLMVLVSFPVIRVNQRQLDWTISGGLFLLAVVLWLAQPIPASFFTPKVRAPAFEVFPYSDAGFYDYSAQTLLVGEGFLNGQIVTRPLYILLLAIWHGMEGQNYSEIIVLQTVVLAAFPAVLYWLGRSMRSREAGLMAGLLAIFRELNAIAATPLTEVSHSKMFMTDSLTGLGISLFCLVIFRWLRKAEIRPIRAVLAGGMLGMLMLLRSQTAFFVPLVLLYLLLEKKGGWKGVAREAGFFLVGVTLAISPWVIRNGIRTGDFSLDQPSQAALMAQRYASTITEALNTHLEASSGEVGEHILNYTLSHPADVARFIGAHFLNNELSTLQVIPLNVSFDDFHDNFQISTLFWVGGISGLTSAQLFWLVINLILVSIGIGSAFGKWRWSGLFPLFIQIAYSLSSAAGRISGWRFIQPVDWVGYFYFCLGFSELTVWIFAASNLSLRPREKVTRELPAPGYSPAWLGAAAGVVLLGGLLLPLAELIIPQRYTPEIQQLAAEIASQTTEIQMAVGQPEEFMQQPGAVRMVGRALYPRWYKADDGEPGNGWAAYKPQPEAHLGFMMVGPYGEQQMVLTIGESPEKFKNAADIIVYGCKKPDFIDVRLVVGYTHPEIFSYSSDNLSRQCD